MTTQNQIEEISVMPKLTDINDQIQNALLKYYKLSDDKLSLKRIVQEEIMGKLDFDLKNDRIGITAVSINSILSGRWIPPAFNNGRVFKQASDKESYAYKIVGRKFIVTPQQAGRLIVDQLKVVFPDLLLEISEG